MLPDFHDRMARISFATKLEIVSTINIDDLDHLEDIEESSIHTKFSFISKLGGTAIKEVVAWHNVKVLDISPDFQVFGFHPAKKVTLLKDDNGQWMGKLRWDEEQIGEHLK
jgi:hypothetical protein